MIGVCGARGAARVADVDVTTSAQDFGRRAAALLLAEVARRGWSGDARRTHVVDSQTSATPKPGESLRARARDGRR